MKYRRIIIFLALYGLYLCSSAYAEKIILKSGKVIEAPIIEKRQDSVKVSSGGIEFVYYLDEILSIEGDPEEEPVGTKTQANLVDALSGIYQDFWNSFPALSQEDVVNIFTRYYQNPQPLKVEILLEQLLNSEFFNKDSLKVSRFIYFIAIIKHNDPELSRRIDALKDKYDGKRREALESLIAQANSLPVLEADSLENLSKLWIEFIATGNMESIKKIMHALNKSKVLDAKILESAKAIIKWNVYEHKKLFDFLKTESMDKSSPFNKPASEILGDLSDIHLEKGFNHSTLNETEEAIKEYNLALELYPDNPHVYTNLANTYEKKGDLQRAFDYTKRAAASESAGATEFYNLARHYFMQRNYDEAITYDLKALELYPNKPNYNHGIARSYQERGDIENAIKYFKKYLELAPNGEHVHLVKQYLASVNAPFEKNPESIVEWLKAGQYDKLEKKLAATVKNKKKNKEGCSELALAYDELTNSPGTEYIRQTILEYLKAWVGRFPSSHFANASTGIFLIEYAWDARGSGWSATVTDEGRKLFKERLFSARDYLEKAHALNDTDALVPANLITVAMALGSGRNEIEKQFSLAIKADNTEFEAYYKKLVYLMPKWGGSEKEMFEFARKSTANAPANTLISRLVAKAHWEKHNYSENKDYFKDPLVWDEAKAAYLKILEYFPEANQTRNWLAYTAYKAGDYLVASEQLAIIGDDWISDCWGNAQQFNKIKAEILSQSAPKMVE